MAEVMDSDVVRIGLCCTRVQAPSYHSCARWARACDNSCHRLARSAKGSKAGHDPGTLARTRGQLFGRVIHRTRPASRQPGGGQTWQPARRSDSATQKLPSSFQCNDLFPSVRERLSCRGGKCPLDKSRAGLRPAWSARRPIQAGALCGGTEWRCERDHAHRGARGLSKGGHGACCPIPLPPSPTGAQLVAALGPPVCLQRANRSAANEQPGQAGHAGESQPTRES
jgi:hypothetical protein